MIPLPCLMRTFSTHCPMASTALQVRSEDSEIPHHLLKTKRSHESISTQDLDSLICHKPSCLGCKDLGDGSLQLVILIARVHGSCHHVGHGLGGVVDHAHLGNLLLNSSIAIDP